MLAIFPFSDKIPGNEKSCGRLFSFPVNKRCDRCRPPKAAGENLGNANGRNQDILSFGHAFEFDSCADKADGKLRIRLRALSLCHAALHRHNVSSSPPLFFDGTCPGITNNSLLHSRQHNSHSMQRAPSSEIPDATTTAYTHNHQCWVVYFHSPQVKRAHQKQYRPSSPPSS